MQIIIVVGHVCSGKSTWINNFTSTYCKKIDIGDIVRRLTQTEKRTHKSELDIAIVDELCTLIRSAWVELSKDTVVITGVRQMSIIGALLAIAQFTYSKIRFVYLDVPFDILKIRYQNSKRAKDSELTFEEAIERDNQLGLTEVVKYIRERKNCIEIKSHNSNETNNFVQES